MQIASQQIAMLTDRLSRAVYRRCLPLAHTYGRDFACLRGVARRSFPRVDARGDALHRARLRKARARRWVVPVYPEFIINSVYTQYTSRAFPGESSISGARRDAQSRTKRHYRAFALNHIDVPRRSPAKMGRRSLTKGKSVPIEE